MKISFFVSSYHLSIQVNILSYSSSSQLTNSINILVDSNGQTEFCFPKDSQTTLFDKWIWKGMNLGCAKIKRNKRMYLKNEISWFSAFKIIHLSRIFLQSFQFWKVFWNLFFFVRHSNPAYVNFFWQSQSATHQEDVR